MDAKVEETVYDGFTRYEINYAGLAGLIVFYVLILFIGLFATWKSKTLVGVADADDIMLAGRNIGAVVGVFTMTATWVGGGYINGTAESVFTPGSGLAWTHAPWGYALSLIVGGMFYAKPMREKRYVTMLDPFEQKFGSVMAALCYIPALLGEIFWSGAILSALGASLTVIIGMHHTYTVIISGSIAIFYTLLGGLYSVAFTDVIQLVCIAFGLLLTIPFALKHPAVDSIWDHALSSDDGSDGWVGKLHNDPWIGNWLDSALLLIMGGVPWQVYFQRVLSAKTPRHAQLLSYLAALGSMLMALPPIFIGAIAKATDWNQTDYRLSGQIPMPEEDYKLLLPLVMQYLTPPAVAVIGLGAVSAAVMSSADSSVLSASCMFAKNIYKPLRNAFSHILEWEQASDREILWVMRVGILMIGAAAMDTAIVVRSIYGLWFLCSDLVYVILFPQLTCVLFLPFVNTYGALAGWIIGLLMRLTGGEPQLGLPAAIKYPNYDEETGLQLTPFKTIAMLISLTTIILVSGLMHECFKRNFLPAEADVFHCYNDGDPEFNSINRETDKQKPEGADNPAFDTGPDNTRNTYQGRRSLGKPVPKVFLPEKSREFAIFDRKSTENLEI